MEIEVVDVGDRGMCKAYLVLTNPSYLNRKNVIDLKAGDNGIQRMIDAISKIADLGTVDVLRLYAHGNEGMINVAGGQEANEDGGSTISLVTIKTLKPLLESLTPYFAPNARVEFHGCEVASGTDGEKLMVALSRMWGVRVQASPDLDPMGAVQFQTRVYEASPAMSCAMPTEMTRG